ncbi:STAS/SEC14 domain-containing protein [Phaeovulum sp.]|uniref:STAS/SEC14 domain-containing protein n=1 Tax=Phaeovulum sp. TaxID=2934796 RepID=UPI0039E4E7C8
MLSIKELSPNVWELTLEGVLEKGDIETMERELTPALKGAHPLGLIVRAEGWKDITAGALAEDMKFEFGLLAQWSKIAKMAMVTDLQVFAALLKWVDPILPMIDMKSFASSEVAAAEAFASDLPDRSEAGTGSAITLLADGSDGVLAFEVDGLMTAQDLKKLMGPLEPILQDDRKINLFAKFTNYGGFDPSILTDGSFLGAKFGAIGHLDRYAIVGGPAWIRAMIKGIAPMMPFKMRLFELTDEAEAREWVGLKGGPRG